MRLSVLDFDTPGSAVNLASELDGLGYHRYWLGEHHTPIQCANPLLLGALIAATTQGIRLGSGGVCLTFHSTYRVAEDARLIEFLLPDRFDLGVTRGLMDKNPVMTAVLDGRSFDSLASFPEKFADVHGYVTGRLPESHPLYRTRPYLESGPPIWALGVGIEAAQLAARYGTGFCFSIHHAPREIDGSTQMKEYRSQFQPSPEFPEPTAIVVVSCICALTEAEALGYQQIYVEATAGNSAAIRERVFKTPMIVGSPDQCSEAFSSICKRLKVDEIMIVDLVGNRNFEARLEMYRLLARQCGLSNRTHADEHDGGAGKQVLPSQSAQSG